jgi:hypothetical protein
MDSSAKRKVGAIALIVAGIGAFLVPFLLHSPALQASSNNGGNTNNNNGRTPATSCTSNCTPPSGDTNPTTCTSDPKTTGSSDNDNEGKHLAKGHDKQDTSIVGKAHGFITTLGKHNPQHDATHSTKTDNHTIKNHALHANGNDNDDGNTCADNKDNDSSDDEANDD